MKEKRVARSELAVDALEPLQRGGDALGIGARLVADRAMIDPAHAVRAPQHLNASIGPRRAVDGDEGARGAAQKKMIALLDRRRYLNNLVREVNETLGA